MEHRKKVKIFLCVIRKFILATPFVFGFAALLADWDELTKIFNEKKALISIINITWELPKNLLLKNPFMFFLSLFFCVIAVIIYKNLCIRGGLNINNKSVGRISFYSLLNQLNPFIAHKTIENIHCFQHKYHEKAKILKSSYKTQTLNIGDALVVSIVEDLLREIKKIIYYALRIDVAVHLKLFQSKMETPAEGNFNINNALLHTYVRVPSNKEIDLRSKGSLEQRKNLEQFKIILDTSDIEQLKKKELGEHTRINTAYNYVFNKTEHFFVCNDLEKAKNKKIFYSNSDSYEKYYDSLVVFIISHHLSPGGEVDCHPPGILVIDSQKKNCFDRNKIQMLAGYFAHRLYDFFVLLNHLSSKQKKHER